MQAHCDVLIFGAGIAGLWTAARLRVLGFSTLVLERAAAGGVQSIASQGIIHGGVKYALTGEAGAASRAIAAMPERWSAALGGSGEIDLSGVRRLSPCTWMWTTPGLVSRVAGLAASKVLRTIPRRVEAGERPAVLSGERLPRGVDVYRVDEPVLDARSLSEALIEQVGPVGRVERVLTSQAGAVAGESTVEVESSGERVTITCRHVLLLGGAGNPALAEALRSLAPPAVQMQVRPLHMVMVRGKLPELFGHCLGASSLPRLTVTTWNTPETGGAGERVWYVGGQVAEQGVGRDEESQAEAAKRELRACLPWCEEVKGARWASVRVDRAEGLTSGGQRPDLPVVVGGERVTVGWPSKLALAPLLADRVIEHLNARGVKAPGSGAARGGGAWPGAVAERAGLPWEFASWR